jgi:RNase H-like domain found in reverse transcriptase
LMYPKRAHLLKPLTDMMKVDKQAFKSKWRAEQSKAFVEAKAMVAKDVLLRYPDPNKTFVIDTDASDYQLGAVIKQDDKPIAYYSRKLTTAQQKYSTIKKELLSILEVLEYYRAFLWGRDILINTNHRNLTYGSAKSQRVLNWKLLVEDFAPRLN